MYRLKNVFNWIFFKCPIDYYLPDDSGCNSSFSLLRKRVRPQDYSVYRTQANCGSIIEYRRAKRFDLLLYSLI